MFLQQLVNGLVVGSVYALVALGYTMIYGILGIINFAQGEIYMYGAFGAVLTLAATGNLGLAVLAGIGSACIVGVILERIAFRPLRGTHPLIPLISAIGASIFLSSLARLLFGPDDRSFPLEFHPASHSIFGAAQVTGLQLVIMCVSVGLMVILTLFVNLTKHGKAILAVEMDREAALIMGINTERINSLSFGIGSALVGVAGALLATHYYIYPFVGGTFGLICFCIVALGGFGSIEGAFIAGILVGVAQTVGGYLFNPAYKLAIVFLMYLITVWIRPQGFRGW